MPVRPATFSDIPPILIFLQATYLRTHYAKSGLAEIDVAETKRLLVNSIQRHGNSHGGATWVMIAEKNGQIEGILLGTLARVYSIFDRLMATDLLWVTSKEADPRDAIALMKSMVEWAKGCPHVIEIHCGATGIIADDPTVATRILAHLGFKQYGLISRMELERA